MIENIKMILKDLFGIDEEITMQTSLQDDLSIDSLDMIEFVADLEATFGFNVADDEMLNLKTIQDVVDYIEKKIG